MADRELEDEIARIVDESMGDPEIDYGASVSDIAEAVVKQLPALLRQARRRRIRRLLPSFKRPPRPPAEPSEQGLAARRDAALAAARERVASRRSGS